MKIYHIFLTVFLITFSASLASDSDSVTETYPYKTSHKIKTAEEFIGLFEKERAYYEPKSTLLLIHVEGILTEEAYPNPHHYETAKPCTPLVNYLRNNMEDVTIVYTSHLFPAAETFERLKDIGLLDDSFHTEDGELVYEYHQHSFQKLKIERSLNCALVRRITSNIADQQVCYQNFNYQKAFAPSAIHDFVSEWRQIVYLDHSELCIERFENDLPYTPYFPHLERIVTVQIKPQF